MKPSKQKPISLSPGRPKRRMRSSFPALDGEGVSSFPALGPELDEEGYPIGYDDPPNETIPIELADLEDEA